MSPPLEHVPSILVDECVAIMVAHWLRDEGFDARHVTEVGRRGRPDHEQLEYAGENGMLLLTYNVVDFLELDREWRMTGRLHAGILLAHSSVYQRQPRALVNDIRGTVRRLAEQRSRDDAGWMHNQVWWVRRGEAP